MRSTAHWYNITAFDEKSDFFGERRVAFKLHMDINDPHDVKTAREIAINKIFEKTATTYEEVANAAVVMNFSRQ